MIPIRYKFKHRVANRFGLDQVSFQRYGGVYNKLTCCFESPRKETVHAHLEYDHTEECVEPVSNAMTRQFAIDQARWRPSWTW